MGHFEGNTFVGDGPLWADIMEWDMSGSMAANQPYKNFVVNTGSFQIRHYPVPSPDRILARVTTSAGVRTMVPALWQVQCISGIVDQQETVDQNVCPDGQVAFFMDAQPPEGCICDETGCGDANDPNNPCNSLWPPRMEQVAFDGLPAEDISVRWVNKGVQATVYYMDYVAKFPKYNLYPINFWKYPDSWSAGTDLLFDFPISAGLPETGVQTLEASIAGVQDPYILKYNVTTLDPLPTIAATKETDDGIKTTILAKEIKAGLKITWDDPLFKQIQKPGIQQRIYIGSERPKYEYYYWIDSPAQLNKILIPINEWNELKQRLISEGFTRAVVSIIYRTIDNDFWNNQAYPEMFPYDPAYGVFMNRGHSDLIYIDLE